MQLTEISYDSAVPVDGYGPGFFRIAGTVIKGPVLVLPNGAGGWQGWDDPALIIDAAVALDVILVGTGASMVPVPATFRASVEAAGIAIEPMPSPVACRTYNVLAAEGRRVGLAALPIE